MTVLCAFLSFIYIAINLPKFKVKEIRKKFLFNVIFIICISSFFWLPFLETSVDTKYEVYETGKMSSKEDTQSNGISFKQLLITDNKNNFVFEFGPIVLIMLCFTIAAFRRIAPEMKKEYIFFLIIGILSTFMATKYFPWKLLGDKISFIQFPWRMLEISSFCFSLICAINLAIVIKNFKFLDALVIIFIVVIYTFALKGFVRVTDDVLKKPQDIDYGFVTGRNTDCFVGMGKNEYLPKKAYDNCFYLATREKGILILEGNAKIEDFKKNGNEASCEIEVLENETLLELPYVYYPGYTVTIDGSKITTFESDNGFLLIGLNKLEKSDLKIEYTGTPIMKFSKIFSAISVFLFLIYVISSKFRKKVQNEKNIDT